MSDELIVERSGAVCRVTLNRPPHNALNEPMLRQMIELTQDLRSDADCRVVVIRGSGELAFCAGGDVNWMVDQTPITWNVIARDLIGLAFNSLASLPMPVVAAVDGHCMGGGFEMALACDLILATRRSRFAMSEVRLGVFPGGGGTVRLAQTTGLNVAKELVLTGRAMGAEEANVRGVVNRLAEDGELEAVVDALVADLLRCGPQAVRFAKRSMDHAISSPQPQALDYETELVSLLFGSPEQVEGFTAFIEKRHPSFRIDPVVS